MLVGDIRIYPTTNALVRVRRASESKSVSRQLVYNCLKQVEGEYPFIPRLLYLGDFWRIVQTNSVYDCLFDKTVDVFKVILA